jgi:hypothetical protein
MINNTEKILISNLDAQIWAKEFINTVKLHPEIATDKETMIGWFANAIMTGYDNALRINPTNSAAEAES